MVHCNGHISHEAQNPYCRHQFLLHLHVMPALCRSAEHSSDDCHNLVNPTSQSSQHYNHQAASALTTAGHNRSRQTRSPAFAGFVKGLASIKANVPKLQYTGQAVQSVSASSVDARLILYCGDQQSTKLLTAALPTANEYSPVLYADDIASIASPQLSAQAPLTSVSLT